MKEKGEIDPRRKFLGNLALIIAAILLAESFKINWELSGRIGHIVIWFVFFNILRLTHGFVIACNDHRYEEIVPRDKPKVLLWVFYLLEIIFITFALFWPLICLMIIKDNPCMSIREIFLWLILIEGGWILWGLLCLLFHKKNYNYYIKVILNWFFLDIVWFILLLTCWGLFYQYIHFPLLFALLTGIFILVDYFWNKEFYFSLIMEENYEDSRGFSSNK